MEKLATKTLAVSMSVIFYVVTYYLLTWQWLETLLSAFVSTLFLYLFLITEIIPSWVNLID
jgi:divalent metal cation (Fe/Co/Zn/Cd) transporter